MNLQEEIEKAFRSGIEYAIKYGIENGDVPNDIAINKELINYINGNQEPHTS